MIEQDIRGKIMLVSPTNELTSVITQTIIENCRQTLGAYIFQQCLVAARLERFQYQPIPTRSLFHTDHFKDNNRTRPEIINPNVRPLTTEEMSQLCAAIYQRVSLPVYKLLLHQQANRLVQFVTGQHNMQGWQLHSLRLKIQEAPSNERLKLAIESLQKFSVKIHLWFFYKFESNGSLLIQVEPCLNCRHIEAAGQPVCDGVNQLLLESLRWLTDVPLFGSEIECRAEGAAACLHRIKVVQPII